MLKALAWKEFRELLPMILLALVAEFALVCSVPQWACAWGWQPWSAARSRSSVPT